jgi:hypothetical protein
VRIVNSCLPAKPYLWLFTIPLVEPTTNTSMYVPTRDVIYL